MRKDEFVTGEEWAYRPGCQLGTPAQRVGLVAMPNRKGPVKVKVRHLDGELEGMDEFVSARHLLCPWKRWKRVERDEKKHREFLEHMDHEEEIERTLLQAVSAVLASSGEDLMADEHRNFTRFWDVQLPGLKRVVQRAGLAEFPKQGRTSYESLDGSLYLPNVQLIELAMAFAKVEPETVNLFLDLEEQELLREGYQYGEFYPHRRVLQQRPAWALARQWAAGAQGRDHLTEEAGRLRGLLSQAIRELRGVGEERTAARLERALEGR